METDTRPSDQSGSAREKTEFAKRNPYLEKLVPDSIENAVDAMVPDKLEKVHADRKLQHGTEQQPHGPATSVFGGVTHG